MRKYCFLAYLATIVLLISCANQSSAKAQGKPIAFYKKYIEFLSNTSDEDLLSKYWSRERLAEGIDILADKTEENKLNRNAVVFSIRFPNEMKNILSMKESIKNDTACVLVTGTTDEGKNIIFNIPYILENEKWKISEVFIKYLEDNQPVPTKPNCNLEIP